MPRRYQLDTTTEIFGVERDVQIGFFYSKGYPEQGPSYSSGGEPAQPAEIEIDTVSVKDPCAADKNLWVDTGTWLANLVQEAVNSGAMEWEQFADAVER